MNKSQTQNQCHFCSKVGKTRRCSNCKRVYYCSQTCQKNDWQAGHKRYCKFTVVDAMWELHRIVGDMSVQESIEQFHKTSDALNSKAVINILEHTFHCDSTDKKQIIANATGDIENETTKAPHSSSNVDSIPIPKGEWNYCIEKLGFISTYVVTLAKPQQINQEIQLVDIRIDTIQLKRGTNIIMVYSKKVCLADFILPNRISSTKDEIVASLQYDKNNVSFRVRFEGSLNESTDRTFLDTKYKPLPRMAFNNLKCRSCESKLNREPNNYQHEALIEAIYPLPSGYWDEITDYLTCFEGVSIHQFLQFLY